MPCVLRLLAAAWQVRDGVSNGDLPLLTGPAVNRPGIGSSRGTDHSLDMLSRQSQRLPPARREGPPLPPTGGILSSVDQCPTGQVRLTLPGLF